jgi:hypothetical protein
MRVFTVTEEDLAVWWGVVGPLLDERAERLVGSASAQMLGRGGKAAMVEVTGMGWQRLAAGDRDIDAGQA